MARPKDPALRSRGARRGGALEFSEQGLRGRQHGGDRPPARGSPRAGCTSTSAARRSCSSLCSTSGAPGCGLRSACQLPKRGVAGDEQVRSAVLASFLDYHFQHAAGRQACCACWPPRCRAISPLRSEKTSAAPCDPFARGCARLLTEGARDGSLFAGDPRAGGVLDRRRRRGRGAAMAGVPPATSSRSVDADEPGRRLGCSLR